MPWNGLRLSHTGTHLYVKICENVTSSSRHLCVYVCGPLKTFLLRHVSVVVEHKTTMSRSLTRQDSDAGFAHWLNIVSKLARSLVIPVGTVLVTCWVDCAHRLAIYAANQPRTMKGVSIRQSVRAWSTAPRRRPMFHRSLGDARI